MQSAKSYFNKTLYLKNLTRFWPVWVLYLTIWFFALPVQLLVRFRGGVVQPENLLAFADRTPLNLLNSFGLPMALIFGLLAAMSVFSYLYNHRSACLMHTLPIRREGLFLTSYLSGLTFLVLPHLVIFFLTLGLEALGGAVNFGVLFMWFCAQTFTCLFFYSFAVFCAMFTGHILALPLFYGILNFLATGMAMILISILNCYIYGFSSWPLLAAIASPLTPFLTLCGALYTRVVPDTGVYRLMGMETVLVYAAAGLVLAALALLLYRRRNVERAGDVVAVGWVKPIFRYGVALCAGLALGTLLASLLIPGRRNNIWQFLPFLLFAALLGYFASEMLLQKSFRVFHRWKGCGVLLLLLTAATACVGLGASKFETWVPAPGAVASVTLSGLSSTTPYDGSQNQFTADDPQSVAQVVALHGALAGEYSTVRDHPSPYENLSSYEMVTTAAGSYSVQTEASAYLQLTYTLKSGIVVSRQYEGIPVTADLLADPASPAALLDSLLNAPATLSRLYPLLSPEHEGSLLSASLDLRSPGGGSYLKSLSTEDSQILFAAVLEDLAAGRFHRYLMENEARMNQCYLNDLTFTFQEPPQGEDPLAGPSTATMVTDYDTRYDPRTCVITLQTTATATLDTLQKLGLDGQFITQAELSITESAGKGP